MPDPNVIPPPDPNGLVNNPTANPAPPLPTVPTATPITPVSTYQPTSGQTGLANATGYQATPYQVSDQGLVQSRVKDIVGEDSPLMQQAKGQAAIQMNSRGLLNSSLNTQAAQQAVIANAVPIATSDANSINQAMTNTANAKNVASQFGASAENTASQTNAQLLSAMNQFNANSANTAANANAMAENNRMLANIDNNSKNALAVLSAQNSQLLQTNANASNMFQETVKNIAAISVNDTMTPAAKDAAIATQMNLLNQGLQTSSGIASTLPPEVQGLNLSNYFQSASGTASFTPAQKQAQITNLQSQLSEAQARAKDVAQNGTGVPVLSGPNASERRVPLWQQAIQQANQVVTDLQRQIDALNQPVAA